MRRTSYSRMLFAFLFLLFISSAVAASTSDTDTATTATDTSSTDTATTATTTSDTTDTTATATSDTSTGTATSTSSTTSSTATTSGTSTTSSTSSTTSTSSTSTSSTSTSSSSTSTIAIPTIGVPDTAYAPYMQVSSLPEGTVFIAVGAFLAFLGACVVAWRVLVAWSINRSVKKAALASIMSGDSKSSPGGWGSNPFKPAGGFYSKADGGSTLSFGEATPTKRRPNAGLRNPIPSTGSGLYFSPTAAATTNATTNIPMTGLGASKSSSFLPAGYYASSSAQVGGASPQANGGVQSGAASTPSAQGRRSSRPLSTSNLVPPNFREAKPQSSVSSMRVGLGTPDSGAPRAPSLYLQGLYEGHHGNPGVPMPRQRDGDF